VIGRVVISCTALALGFTFMACSGAPRVPPGLPAPEYEQPEVTPWPPDAGGEPQAEAEAAKPEGAATPESAASSPDPASAGAPGQ
jgi:hypothetical protein